MNFVMSFVIVYFISLLVSPVTIAILISGNAAIILKYNILQILNELLQIATLLPYDIISISFYFILLESCEIVRFSYIHYDYEYRYSKRVLPEISM
jgi:hypothetical protein